MVLILGSLWLLDGEWLRARLETRLAASLDADVRIGDVGFSPFSGRATIRDVRIRRERPESELSVDLREGRAEFSVWNLVLRSVHVRRLELDGPVVESKVRLPEAPPSGGTLSRIGKALKEKWDEFTETAAPREKERPEFRVDRLVIRNGTFGYERRQGTARPFRFRLGGLEYSASDVSVHSLHHLVWGAELKGRIDEPSGTIVKTGGRLEVKGLPLADLDPWFDQTDALTMTGGEMELLRENLEVHVRIRGMKLASNPEAKSQEFLFVPVGKIIESVEGRKGNLEFGYTVRGLDVTPSADLEELLREAWKGLWKAILKEQVDPDGR